MKSILRSIRLFLAGALLAAGPALHAADAPATPPAQTKTAATSKKKSSASMLRGRIVSVDAAKGTLVLAHGDHQRTINLDANTTFKSASGQSITRNELRPGDPIAVHVSHKGDKVVATSVSVQGSKTKPAKTS